jgi:phage shock protein A
VPTFEEVRTKIEARYAKAQGVSEIASESVESRMLEVETAQMDTAAQARLSEIRAKMGLTTGTAAAQPAAAPDEVTEGGSSS